MRLKEKAAAESEAEDFAAAIASLDAALTLWPDHPVDGNPKLKEAKMIAQQRLEGQKLFAKAEQLFLPPRMKSPCCPKSLLARGMGRASAPFPRWRPQRTAHALVGKFR